MTSMIARLSPINKLHCCFIREKYILTYGVAKCIKPSFKLRSWWTPHLAEFLPRGVFLL